MPQKCNGCGYIKNLWVLLVSFLFYALIKIYCTPWVYSVSVVLFWNLKPAFRFKWKHKTAHRGTEPLCWLTSAGWSSALTFIAEWQLKCLLKIKQKLCPGTVRVTRATLAAHEPEKPKIKNKRGKPKVSSAKFPPWWASLHLQGCDFVLSMLGWGMWLGLAEQKGSPPLQGRLLGILCDVAR